MNQDLGGSSCLASVLRYLNHHEAITEWPSSSRTVACSIVSLLSCYLLFAYLDLLPFTFSGALWNFIVFLTPTRIILALDKGSNMTPSEEGTGGASTFLHFRSKSEAMQRILGLDKSSIFSSFPKAKRHSMATSSIFGISNANPPGLGNWDNSCYQNSVIQGLAALRSLDEFLEHNIETLGSRHSFATHLALKDIVQRLNCSSNGGKKLWIPRELKSMSTWQQQDAQEYFSKLIDQLDKEIRDASRGLTRDVGLKIMEPARALSSDCGKAKEVLEKLQCNSYDSPFVNPLEGLLAQRVGCMRCGWTEGLTLFQFNCLTIPLGRGWEYELSQCLDDYTALEFIEGVECAKCTLLQTKTKLENLLQRFHSESESDGQAGSRLLNDALRDSAESRLKAVQTALDEEDYSEKTLSGPCHIARNNRVSSTKSRQAVIARAPKSLAIHVNRSMFDELTGELQKNYADVRFPKVLDLGRWCLGKRCTERDDEVLETWAVDPSESMLPRHGVTAEASNNCLYELRAVITHFGRHENGHYICYRKYSVKSFPAAMPDNLPDELDGREKSEHWFRLSDEHVSLVSESTVLAQGGVFMLFYELMDDVSQSVEAAETMTTNNEKVDSDVDLNGEIALKDVPNATRECKNVGRQPAEIEETPQEAGVNGDSTIADFSDVSSSSTSSNEDTTPGFTKQGVPRAGLVMRTSYTVPSVPGANAPRSSRSPISSSIVAAN